MTASPVLGLVACLLLIPLEIARLLSTLKSEVGTCEVCRFNDWLIEKLRLWNCQEIVLATRGPKEIDIRYRRINALVAAPAIQYYVKHSTEAARNYAAATTKRNRVLQTERDVSIMGAWVTQLRRGLVELCVLAILNEEEAYGYEIVERLNEKSNLDVSESTVYPILARLHRDKHLAERKVASSSGPPRRYFQLTKVGRLHFVQMIEEWESLNSSVHQLVKKGLRP